jgi:hypothetical protein
MGDVTIFTIPRGFKRNVGDRQHNAVQSWLRSGYNVLLCGDDPGVIDYAQEVGADSLPDIKRNEWGTPLLNDVFEQVQARLAGELLAYVNTDIMLDDGLGQAIVLMAKRFDRFLVVGRRYDVVIDGLFEFGDDWQERLRLLADPNRLHGEFGLDYFGFRAPLWSDIPPLAVGRMRWDNWLLHQATRYGAETVDGTTFILAVHQNHDYEHIPALSGPDWIKDPEIKRNLALAGNCQMGTNSTAWVLDEEEIRAR